MRGELFPAYKAEEPQLSVAGRRRMIEKIISGGQTGVDRAGLDFAIAQGIPHGGWCPKGRMAEDGVIDGRYRLEETPSADSAQRTEWNVRDSDATVIFSIEPTLSGGTARTVEFAMQDRKPWLHLCREEQGSAARERLKGFLRAHSVKVLNVAGPRQSEEAGAGAFAREVLEAVWLGLDRDGA